jgi:hypothetical protein
MDEFNIPPMPRITAGDLIGNPKACYQDMKIYARVIREAGNAVIDAQAQRIAELEAEIAILRRLAYPYSHSSVNHD